MGIEVLSPLVYEGSPLISKAQADLLYATLAHTHTFASLTAKPTTLAGYGITDTLTLTVAGLSGTITASGLKTALTLVKADVGLGNVDNTSDANKPVSTAQQTALNLKANTAAFGPNDDADQRVRYSSIKVADSRTYNSIPSAYSAGEFLEFKSLSAISLTVSGYIYGLVITDKPWNDFSGGPARQTAQVGPHTYVRIAVSGEGSWTAWKRMATEDDLNKTSVGLGNVDNTSDANKPVSTAQQAALNGKVSLNGTESIAGLKYVSRLEQLPTGVPVSNLGNPSLTEMALFEGQFNNKIWFADPSRITVEQTTDGTTWTTAAATTAQKKGLVSGTGSSTHGNLAIPYGVVKYRVNITQSGYVYLNALYSYYSTNGHATQVQVWAKRVTEGDWVQITSSNTAVASWPGHLHLPFSTIPLSSNAGQFSDVRIEFIPSWNATYSANPIVINTLELWGGYPAGKRTIYTWDYDQNVTFPAQVTAAQFNGSGAGLTGLTKTMVGLPNVDNTSDAAKPVSTATQTALNLKADTTHTHSFASLTAKPSTIVGYGITDALSIDYINGRVINDGNLANTAGISAHYLANLNKPSGVTDGSLLSLNYSNIWSTQIFGDWRTGNHYVRGQNNGTWQAWLKLATNVDLDLKANLASPTFTGTVSGITKTMVGLGNVDNTSDVNKPISTATQTALDLKAPLVSPTFTGTVYAGGKRVRTQDWTTKNASYTMIAGDKIQANTAAGSFTLTLPTSPVDGDRCEIQDVRKNFATNPLTVGGGTIMVTGTTTDTSVLVNVSGAYSFTYVASLSAWTITKLSSGVT